ncbi:probable glycosyltransferase At5g03795 [Malania oleifera]|uniref:probable glycosyltransferase At5g03795 n=1 Tax=Malania oleifera TaxID=397392 RepID=UPI0025ADF2D3|nr:probable glycosyltransferase At5g03795 [Malania oleifera]XP_057968265.1 probable glycosyltransferase At5g03795 [Malania oleifera]XP_057968266.1 probable glycosyltransferase At5g03795 [Malania oleifera]
MDFAFQRLCQVDARRLLLILGTIVSTVVVFQYFELPSANYILSPVPAGKILILASTGNDTHMSNSKSTDSHVATVVANNTNIFYLGEEYGYEDTTKGVDGVYDLASYNDGAVNSSFAVHEKRNLHNFKFGSDVAPKKNSTRMIEGAESTDNISTIERAAKVKALGNNSVLEYDGNLSTSSVVGKVQNGTSSASLSFVSPNVPLSGMDVDADSKTSVLYVAVNISLVSNSEQPGQTQLKDKNSEPLKTVSIPLNNNSRKLINSTRRRGRKKPTSISQMYSLLLNGLIASASVKRRWSSIRERQLLSAKLHILNAPVARKTPGLHASLFRNVSMFMRSYDLMEHILKVYIYKEGEKPIFHQPQLRGIYASEGWFMELMEGNKQFVVRNPSKAHLFYLPFSSKMLRVAYAQSLPNHRELEEYLKNYVVLIAEKYIFWNRTGGMDHFFVACHDWAPQVTRSIMQNCIRVLCNANVAKGFNIGKDTALPVTYVRDEEDPQKDLQGKSPSQRPILAFFAGSMHGYVRPILLQYWENKEPDMKISGPMPRDSRGKKIYREHMSSSKYCICARGYEVHTPRVVEAIFSGCVPVIISDNYVPPFFEVLDWEAFSVFILEKDIPNLRNRLLSISEEKYLAMQLRVNMVQQHFLWHKKPMKYDLFHMILHSVWYSRVLQIKT